MALHQTLFVHSFKSTISFLKTFTVAVTDKTPRSWWLNPREVNFHVCEVQSDVSVSWHPGSFHLGPLLSLGHVGIEINGSVLEVTPITFWDLWARLDHLDTPKSRGDWKHGLIYCPGEKKMGMGKTRQSLPPI